jgi:CHAD domain-containing protein
MSITSERCHIAFRKTERDLLRLFSSQQTEQVHAFRTTTRRLQTLLEKVIAERGRNQKKLLKLLGQIRKRAGKVRDVDVQLAALRSLKIPQEPRRKTQLMHRLIELRAKHEKKLRKLLTKEAIREIRKRLKRAFKDLKFESGRAPLAVARQMLAQVRGQELPLTEDVLHQYRVAVKRARYAVEFAPKSTETTQVLAELTRLQDAIGDWHDWLTLTHAAATSLGDVNRSPLVAALHNVTGGKFRHAVAALSASPTIRHTLKPVPAVSEPSHKPNPKGLTFAARSGSAA